MLIADKTPLAVVASNLGHAQVSTTNDIYSHVIASAEAKAAEVLDQFSDDIHPKREKRGRFIKQKNPRNRNGYGVTFGAATQI